MALAATGFSWLVWEAGLLRGVEAVLWGWRVACFAKPSPHTDAIRLILLDQGSLDWGATEQGWSWPWLAAIFMINQLSKTF